MKKSWIRFLCIVLLLLVSLSTVAVAGFAVPAQFGKAFTGELNSMVERLERTEGQKIVVVGGSSVAFGVDAKLLGETLGLPVVNFGLYATLGTKMMLDLSRGSIGKGDIVVLAPEMNAQLWSLYFNAESTWQAMDGHFGLLGGIASDDARSMLGAYWAFAASKVKYFVNGTDINPAGIYNISSFDEYGFIRYNRDKDYNILTYGYDTGMPLTFDTDMIDSAFISYVNDYIADVKKQGATVYLGFCPMNEDALDASVTMETLETYTAFLAENFDCDLLGAPNNYLYRSGYFYDSNFHPNSAGATVHTRQLALDLAEKLGGKIEVNIEIPAVPEIPKEPDGPEILDYDANEVYFLFNKTKFGVEIVGVSALGKEQTVLTTPKAYDGEKVVTLTKGTFADCEKLTELYVTENITQILDGTFDGAGNVTKIHVPSKNPDNCTVNSISGEAFRGTSPACRVLVPRGSLTDYTGNYFWGTYSAYLSEEE